GARDGSERRMAVDERVGIEEVRTAALAARQAPVDSRRVRVTGAAAVLHVSGAACHRKWEPILQSQDAAQLPAAQYEIGHAAAIQPPAIFSDGDLPYAGGRRATPEVEGRQPGLQTQVVLVRRRQRISTACADAAAVVYRFAVRERAQKAEPVREALLDL